MLPVHLSDQLQFPQAWSSLYQAYIALVFLFAPHPLSTNLDIPEYRPFVSVEPSSLNLPFS
jgi:hypothetical protein